MSKVVTTHTHSCGVCFPAREPVCLSVRPSELLWVAPELLRDPVQGGSFAGDVFSFSIIIQEVITRTLPYAMMDMPACGETAAWTGDACLCVLSECPSVPQSWWSA